MKPALKPSFSAVGLATAKLVIMVQLAPKCNRRRCCCRMTRCHGYYTVGQAANCFVFSVALEFGLSTHLMIQGSSHTRYWHLRAPCSYTSPEAATYSTKSCTYTRHWRHDISSQVLLSISNCWQPLLDTEQELSLPGIQSRQAIVLCNCVCEFLTVSGFLGFCQTLFNSKQMSRSCLPTRHCNMLYYSRKVCIDMHDSWLVGLHCLHAWMYCMPQAPKAYVTHIFSCAICCRVTSSLCLSDREGQCVHRCNQGMTAHDKAARKQVYLDDMCQCQRSWHTRCFIW